MPYTALKSVIVVMMLVLASAVFFGLLYLRLWADLRRGQPSGPFGNWLYRLKGLLVYAGGQLRLFRVRSPGVAHFFIFWGFLFLSLTILQAVFEGLLSFTIADFVLPVVGTWGPLALMQDLFAILVVVAVTYGLLLRLVVKPRRYEGSHKNQAVLVLSFILTIVVSLLLMNGVRMNLGQLAAPAWRPISGLVGSAFAGVDPQGQFAIAETAYWLHLAVVLVFLTELPRGKHFHVVTSLPAVLLRDLEPPGRLRPAPEFSGTPGVGSIEQFRWREMLDFYTCTECGRCQDVCPAFASSTTLSPKLLIMGLRDQLKATSGKSGALSKAATGQEAPSLLGDRISEAALWACTTCYACDAECPLFIERVRLIVDMRRRLVIDGRLDSELQDAFANLARYGNSFGLSERARAKWTQALDLQLKDARREAVDYLWFVGDYASYSPALAEVTVKTAQVLQKAGLDVGILYDAERNAGNDVRRAGEEGLYELLAEKNKGVLDKCEFKTIITTDPHSYNALRNEYALKGNGAHTVLHITQLLDELLVAGQLRLEHRLTKKVTYHDPCYLGRYNGIYDAPRRVIEATGCQLVEMPRHGDRAACCGAGGGRIWMKEGDVDERPSEARVREAAALNGVDSLVVTCPKDIAMFRDAAKTTGVEQRLVVRDLVELVHAAL